MAKTKTLSVKTNQRSLRKERGGIINRVVALTAIKPHPRNYNAHPPEQIELLRESLLTFGQVESVTVQASRTNGHFLCVAGHGVVEAMRAEQMENVRVDIIPAAWSAHRVLAYLAASNETARYSNPDQAQLAQIVNEIAAREGEALARLAAGSEQALENLAMIIQAQMPPPSLDELEKEYGEPDLADFNPVIRIQVTPDVKEQYDSLMREIEGTDDGVKFGKLLSAVNLAALSRAINP